MARILQTAAVRESRLKIPLIFAADIIHGHRTIFPVPLAEVASFEPELARRTAEAAAFEATGAGIDWTFAPMVDVARDQRWGRGVEGGGEDVLLGRLFAAARFIGRVDSGTQIIVFGAAGTARPARQPRHHRPGGPPEGSR
jgi:beta-glucosidase